MKQVIRQIRLMLAGTALLAPLAFAQVSVSKDIVFATVDGKPLKLDLYQGPNKSAPLVVYVHGGAWRNGDKSSGAAFAERLAADGFTVASLDFRQTPEAPFPANLFDIKAGIRFLRAKAKDYGYNADRIAITGESSGAHLAVLAGVTNGSAEHEGKVGDYLGTSSSVQSIVSYFAAADLTTILSQSTPFGLSVREPGLKLLLGDLPDQKADLAKQASPVFHVDAKDPPIYILHGDRDPQMPINQSLQLWGVYKEKGVEATFDAVHGAPHGGPLFYTPEHQKPVVAFLKKSLIGK